MVRVIALLSFGVLFPGITCQDQFLGKVVVPEQILTDSPFSPISAVSAVAQRFEADCESDGDFGYPRFQSVDELKSSPWAGHILKVYGELPSSGYPICMFDFGWLPPSTDMDALGLVPIAEKAGGKPSGWQLPTWLQNIVSQFSPGVAYRYKKGEYVNGDLYGGFGGYIIYRDWYLFHLTPANAWVEISHMAGNFFSHETEAMWFTRSRGSGIWFNVGTTIAFDTHSDGFNHMLNGTGDCKRPSPAHTSDPMAAGAVFENALSKCARSKGFDSVQFRPYPYPVLNTFGQAGWSELFSTRLVGKYACGTQEGGPSSVFRSGWHASRVCDCDPSQNVTNCHV